MSQQNFALSQLSVRYIWTVFDALLEGLDSKQQTMLDSDAAAVIREIIAKFLKALDNIVHRYLPDPNM